MILPNLQEIANSSGVFRSLMDEQQQKCTLELMKAACIESLECAVSNIFWYSSDIFPDEEPIKNMIIALK